MKKINLVFEGDLNDVDILLVPDSIYDNIDDLCQRFLDWESPDLTDQDYWNYDKVWGLVSVAETVGFVKWLNLYYCGQGEKVEIIKQHTRIDRHLKSIEF